MRIMLHGPAPWVKSGYGVQLGLLGPRLVKAGHEVHQLCTMGMQGGRFYWNGVLLHPSAEDKPFGETVIEWYTEDYQPDIVVTHFDVWPLPVDFGALKGVRWITWAPVDHAPLAQPVALRFKRAFWNLPWCQFASTQMRNAGIENQSIVPLMVDTNVFRPLVTPETPKEMFKARSGSTDKDFVLGMVAANMDSRKNVDKVIRAFAEFNYKVRHSKLVIHAPQVSEYGLDLNQLIAQSGAMHAISITPPKHYHLGYDPLGMACWYNGLDVLLLPSSGEGWGLPLVEAQACGLPVIATDFAGMPEIVSTGYLVEPVDMFPTRPHWGMQAQVTTRDILKGMRSVYKSWKQGIWSQPEVIQKAREGALRFDADHVVENYWQPTLAMLEEKIAAERQAVGA